MRWAAAFALVLLVATLLGSYRVRAQDAEPETAAAEVAENQCLTCHAEPELWDGDDKRFFITPDHLKDDVHWTRGLRCHECHGGDPTSDDYGTAHSEESGFKEFRDPKAIPGFCGSCHSDPRYMRRFNPSARTDQESEFWTSGHGTHLKETGDPEVANCVSCHGNHGIRRVDDLLSPVYPTRVAKTCAECHADPDRMNGREYEGKPLGHGQYDAWSKSVHGRAMLEGGDVSAPTCNDCHGNHGALPPEIGSVANACGACHGKVADLFRDTQMAHAFERAGLPGCGTCHGTHDIGPPTDDMLGMTSAAVCTKCHEKSEFGATVVGAGVAQEMRDRLEGLKSDIAHARERVEAAERLGMEVRTAKFELLKAHDALQNARTLIHTFKLPPLDEAITAGRTIASQVTDQAEGALAEHTSRRIWLGFSLVLIAVVVMILLRFIRTLPEPEQPAHAGDD